MAMKIVCIGGGPSGLYFAILMKKANPAHDITVIERNRPYDTFGWGVVFSDETLRNLANGDDVSQGRIIDSFAHWDDIDVHFKGRVIRSTGHGFCGIHRKKLLNILQERAEELGVTLEFERNVEDIGEFPDADLIVASDGLNSRIRTQYADHFQPDIDQRKCRFIWLGTKKLFEAFTFIFEETEWGWFQAHAYRFNDEMSTFIVETHEDTWRKAGIDRMEKEEGIAFCESLFSKYLDGHHLESNAAHLRGSAAWINFPRITNKTWIKDNVVLMGDAAHSAHFSIGSGTKLALEDAIGLAQKLKNPVTDLATALREYEDERRVEVLKLQSAARNSTEWFENVRRYTGLEAEQFAYSLLTRSQRVSHENLRLRDRDYLEGMETWFAERATGHPVQQPIPPMFTPYRLRSMDLANRVVMSPMAMYSAKDGTPNDFHLVHFGSRALGGAGLIYTEMTCVSPDARITPGCCGLWTDEHTAQYKRIVDFVHANGEARVCLQLGHAGPKGSTKLGWEGMDEPLDDGNWPLISASAVAWQPGNQVPTPCTRADMDRVIADFEAATRRAIEAGFDMLELHCAHGYLLSAFITPVTNKREDEYGGALHNRLRFPLQVFDAVRAIWPEERPMSVRISATDWHDGGITLEEAVAIAKAFRDHGVDIVDVSAGQTTPEAKPVYGRMFQTPYADMIRNEVGVATIAVGNISDSDQINSILAAGRADLVALARPHLSDPFFTLHAAAKLGYEQQPWPAPYLTGRAQYTRNLQREMESASSV
ncbi:bifunctional salicylyl-CoA 5-hydroxylase/oxidoreductase [Fodinicurvata sp. EGI_FJ10296]|uniref:bifunctional salicylyl-CoA 5-hydroxylase/oxidoreductase n=1 Tax=Fodinicurvata sp. EGI_FJ10296 TaxID=3231908 RepID=UPI003454E5E5